MDVGEDIMLSYLLHGAGWAVSYVKEELQLGFAPGTYKAYIKQRMRWVNALIRILTPMKRHLFNLQTDGSMLVTRYFQLFSTLVKTCKEDVNRPKISRNPTYGLKACNGNADTVAASPTSWSLAHQV